MSSDESDPISSAAKGLTQGALDWSLDKIKELVRHFKDEGLAFINDSETVNTAKAQRNKGEFKIFQEYIKDKDLRILFQMGLTLRHKESKKQELGPIIESILDKYGSKGLHIGRFVQNRCFSKYFGNILDKAKTPERLSLEIKDLFENIDKRVAFVRNTDNIESKAKEITIKIIANSPHTFIISGTESIAMNKCKEIKDKVMSEVSNYVCESYDSSENKEIYFLNRKSEIF